MFKRVISSLGISGLIFAISTVGQVLSVPILLHAWGSQLYGEWLALTNLVASLNLLNAGVQAHVMNSLIGCFVHGEIDRGERILHSALRLYTLLCSLALLVMSGLAFLPSLASFLNISVMPAAHLRGIVVIQGILATYAILEGLLMSLLIATRHQPRRLVYSLVERIVFIGAPMVVAYLGGVPLTASVVGAIFMAGIAITQIMEVRRTSPFALGIGRGSWAEAFGLFLPGFTFFLVSLSFQLQSSGIIIVVSAAIGPVAVALYSTTLMLTNFVRSLVYMGLNVLWPEITSAAAEKSQSLSAWFHLALKLEGTFIIVLAIPLFLLGPQILSLWTRGGIAVDAGLNAILVLYLLVQAPEMVARTFGLALSRQVQVFKVEFAAALLSILLSLFFIPLGGLRAVAWALVAGQFISSVLMVALVLRWTAGQLRFWLQDVVWRGIPALSCAVMTCILINSISDIWVRGALIMASILIFLAAAWFGWLSAPEKNLLYRNLKQLFLSLKLRMALS